MTPSAVWISARTKPGWTSRYSTLPPRPFSVLGRPEDLRKGPRHGAVVAPRRRLLSALRSGRSVRAGWREDLRAEALDRVGRDARERDGQPVSLHWHERRSPLVLDQDHQESGRLGPACVPVDDVNIVGAFIATVRRSAAG